MQGTQVCDVCVRATAKGGDGQRCQQQRTNASRLVGGVGDVSTHGDTAEYF